MWCDYRLDNAEMTSPILYITTTFHFDSSEPSVLNLLNVPHYVNLLWPYLVGTPAGYLKTRPSSGENQHDRQSNDWQHKTGKSRSLEGQPEKAERRLEPTEDQGCTAATRVQADAVRAGAVSRVDREGLQADGRDRSCGGEELLRAGGNWGRTRRCFKGTKTIWIVNCLGCRNGAVLRGSPPTNVARAQCHMWVFFRVLRFSSSISTSSNLNSTRVEDPHENQLQLMSFLSNFVI